MVPHFEGDTEHEFVDICNHIFSKSQFSVSVTAPRHYVVPKIAALCLRNSQVAMCSTCNQLCLHRESSGVYETLWEIQKCFSRVIMHLVNLIIMGVYLLFYCVLIFNKLQTINFGFQNSGSSYLFSVSSGCQQTLKDIVIHILFTFSFSS